MVIHLCSFPYEVKFLVELDVKEVVGIGLEWSPSKHMMWSDDTNHYIR